MSIHEGIACGLMVAVGLVVLVWALVAVRWICTRLDRAYRRWWHRLRCPAAGRGPYVAGIDYPYSQPPVVFCVFCGRVVP